MLNLVQYRYYLAQIGPRRRPKSSNMNLMAYSISIPNHSRNRKTSDAPIPGVWSRYHHLSPTASYAPSSTYKDYHWIPLYWAELLSPSRWSSMHQSASSRLLEWRAMKSSQISISSWGAAESISWHIYIFIPLHPPLSTFEAFSLAQHNTKQIHLINPPPRYFAQWVASKDRLSGAGAQLSTAALQAFGPEYNGKLQAGQSALTQEGLKEGYQPYLF